MNRVHFEPWSLFDRLHSDLDRSALRGLSPADGESAVADWVPAVDIIEHQDRFVVRADVPGVDPAGIDVSMEAGVLSISGDRHAEELASVDAVKRHERSSGRFYRRFALPDTTDVGHITARSSQGILEISIPKLPEVRPRRIAIQAA